MLTVAILLLAMAGCYWLSALCSGTETAYYRTSEIRLRARVDAGERAAVRADRLRRTLPRFVNELLIENNVVNYMATTTFASLWAALGLGQTVAWTTALLTPTLFVAGELLPKQLGYAFPDAWATAVARVFTVARRFVAPVAVPLTALTGFVRKRLARFDPSSADADPRARLLAWFESGVAERAITPDQHRMARRIIALSSLRVADLARPIREVCAIDAAATVRAAMLRMADADYLTDAVVLVDAHGRPTGAVATQGELWRNADAWNGPVSAMARPAPILSPAMDLQQMLDEFRAAKARVALVREGAAFTGAVTARALVDRLLVAEQQSPPPARRV